MFDSQKIRLLALVVVMLVPAVLSVSEGRAQDVVVAEAPEADEPSFFGVASARDVAYMGVQLEEETDHPEGGARVSEVVHDSPAEKAGLQAGDIIVVFDGQTIRGPVGLTKQIHERKPGDTVRVDVLRDGKVKTLEIELADRFAGRGLHGYALAPLGELEFVTPEMEKELQEKIERSLEHLEKVELRDFFESRDCEEGQDCEDLRNFNFQFSWGGRPQLGVQLIEATPELKQHLGSSDGTGVLVSKVMRGLPAEHAGVKVGDMIVRVAGDPVEDVSDLRRALGDRAGETFAIEVLRNGKSLDLDVTLPEADEDEVSGPQALMLRAPRVPVAPRVHVVPPAASVAPVLPDVAVPPVPVAPVAPRSGRQVEAMERQRAEMLAALAEARQEAQRVAEVERVAVRESQRQAREELELARELARVEASLHQQEVVSPDFERAREAYREAAAVQREEARRQREEIRLLRDRLRSADGSV
jgi:membrane-associated protease RseP (regulator of RpoE activity)